jgi:hypothetical protein
MIGGDYTGQRGKVAMRQGRVYVSQIQKTDKFRLPSPKLTPITPGYY